MLSGTCNGYRIQNLKEVKIQHPQKILRCSICGVPFTPSIECSLGILENLINIFCCVQFIINQVCIAFVGKSKLVL